MALFKVDQRVLVIDHDSPHHAMFGKVIVVTPDRDRFFYWLAVGQSNTKVHRFNAGQLEAVG